MAALYEAYTLCGLVPAHDSADSGIQGIESDGDEDRVVVTDCARAVTVYKVNKHTAETTWQRGEGRRAGTRC